MLLPLATLASAAVQPADIIVTGRALPAGAGEGAFSTVTIPRERLTSTPSTRLEEALRDVPGFQLFRRSDARSANPTSQGATLRALGGNASSRALLVLDDVPQADPFGGWVSWPAYDPRRLGQVRVTRGGGTGANGPGALAGTIALSSAGPGDADGLLATITAGSREAVDAFGSYGARLGRGFALASASYARGDGFVPVVARQRGSADRPAPFEQASVAVRGIAPVAPAAELQVNVSAFADSRERGTAFSAIRTRGADASARLIGSGPLPFSALAYVQLRDFSNQFASANPDRTAANPTLDQYSVPSLGLGARAELRPTTGPIELRLGGDWRRTQGETRELYQFVTGGPTRARNAGGRTDTVGLFAEAGLDRNAWSLTAGARLDRWRISDGFLYERVLATSVPLTTERYGNRSGWEPTGRAGVAFRPTELLQLRAAGYLGWRLPTLNELYRPFRLGPDATAANPALAPERIRGVEAGVDLRPGPYVRLGITTFHNRLSNAIGNVTLGQGPGVFPGVGFVSAAGQFRQRQNLDAIVSRGVELDGTLALGAWRLSAGYSFADAQVRASGAATLLDGQRPAQTPRHSAAATLAWAPLTDRSVSVSLRYTGGQFEDDLNRVRLPDALTFDAAALLPLTRRLSLEARAENLTDEEVVAAISSAGIIERATPRTFWLGLRWRTQTSSSPRT